MYLKNIEPISYLNALPSNIRVLDLSYKFKIETLPDLSRFNMLEELYCYKMGLTSISNPLPKSLTKVDFSDNNFEEIPTTVLNLPKLTEFYICWNNLKELDFEIRDSCLKVFDCSYNNIETISNKINKFHFLEKFYCENNKLLYIPKTLPNSLKELYVSYNPIIELPNNLPKNIKVIEAIFCPLIRLPFYLPYNIEKFLYTKNKILLDLYPYLTAYDNNNYNDNHDLNNMNLKHKIKYINKINQILCETNNYCDNYLY